MKKLFLMPFLFLTQNSFTTNDKLLKKIETKTNLEEIFQQEIEPLATLTKQYPAKINYLLSKEKALCQRAIRDEHLENVKRTIHAKLSNDILDSLIKNNLHDSEIINTYIGLMNKHQINFDRDKLFRSACLYYFEKETLSIEDLKSIKDTQSLIFRIAFKTEMTFKKKYYQSLIIMDCFTHSKEKLEEKHQATLEKIGRAQKIIELISNTPNS